MAPWTCAACTFENEGGTRCEICGTANPAVSVKCQKCEELNRGRDNAWDVTLCRECRGKTVEEEGEQLASSTSWSVVVHF
jgi:ribosomal protein L40E